MRTSLNDIRLIEQYLDNQLATPDKLLFEARVLTSPAFRLDVWLQRKLVQLVRLYHRKKIRNNVSNYHNQFLGDPQNAEYREQILKLFKTDR